jgi:hypothetical protein
MDKEIKYYQRNEILKDYNALSYEKKCIVLYEALGWMEQYNGRSKTRCIAMAMGYDNTEGDYDTYFKRKN